MRNFIFNKKEKWGKKLLFTNLFEMNVTNKCSCMCTWYAVVAHTWCNTDEGKLQLRNKYANVNKFRCEEH